MPVALRELGDIYRCQRALLVTDPELYRAGIAAPVALVVGGVPAAMRIGVAVGALSALLDRKSVV